MSIVSLLNVTVLNNPARFTDPYELDITFECLEPLKEDLEWKLVYVGSSTSSEHDQELDVLLVGPVPVGVNRFLFTANPPSPELIPQNDLVSVTVMILSCSYRDKEFVQVGYYVNNEYDSEELNENPPARVAVEHVVRNVLAEKPRVTRFNIPWDSEAQEEYPPEQPDADLEADEEYGNEQEDLQDELVDEEEADEADEDGDASNDGDEEDLEDNDGYTVGGNGTEIAIDEKEGEDGDESDDAEDAQNMEDLEDAEDLEDPEEAEDLDETEEPDEPDEPDDGDEDMDEEVNTTK